MGLLADLKSENGQLEDARADYDASLEIYKAHLDQNDRKIATVLYQVSFESEVCIKEVLKTKSLISEVLKSF